MKTDLDNYNLFMDVDYWCIKAGFYEEGVVITGYVEYFEGDDAWLEVDKAYKDSHNDFDWIEIYNGDKIWLREAV